MLTPDQIPAEAVKAARKFMCLQALSDEWIDDLLTAAIRALKEDGNANKA